MNHMKNGFFALKNGILDTMKKIVVFNSKIVIRHLMALKPVGLKKHIYL